MRGIIFTSGIGRSEKANQSEKMAKRLGLPYAVFNWQKYIEETSDELTIRHTQYGSKFARLARKGIYDYLYDETGYCANKNLILGKLAELISETGFDDVVLIGHSWGAVIMHDYTNTVIDGYTKVSTLITLGCPIPFKRGGDISLPSSIEWFNYWEKNDPIAHKMLKPFCVDIEFKGRHWLKSWNLASHTSYFKSRKLAKLIRKIL